MVATYKLKAQTIQAIDVASPIAQATDIATMIGASAYIADIFANSVTFTVMDGGSTVIVAAGKVVSLSYGVVTVQDRGEFYELFEIDGQ